MGGGGVGGVGGLEFLPQEWGQPPVTHVLKSITQECL